MLDKNIIKNKLIKLLESKVASLSDVVSSSTSEATDSDNKQESKYDTRAIEASYLAGAQKARLENLKSELSLMKILDISLPHTQIKVGSLVKVMKNHESEQYFFFTPKSGAEKVTIEGLAISTLAMTNPLAREFVGLEVGDDFLFEQTENEYEILSIL